MRRGGSDRYAWFAYLAFGACLVASVSSYLWDEERFLLWSTLFALLACAVMVPVVVLPPLRAVRASLAPDEDLGQTFRDAVATYLTPAMEARGFVVCGESEGWGAGYASHVLKAHRSVLHERWSRWRGARLARKVRYLDVGYEGGRDHEYWLWFRPGERTLDASQWSHVLPADVPWREGPDGPLDGDELRHQLEVLGRAVRAAPTLYDDE